MLISILNYLEFFPCLEEDLVPPDFKAFSFDFLPLFLFSESSGEAMAGRFSETVVKSLLQGGLATVLGASSGSESSVESETSEVTRVFGQEAVVVSSAISSVSLEGVFWTTEVTNIFLLKNFVL